MPLPLWNTENCFCKIWHVLKIVTRWVASPDYQGFSQFWFWSSAPQQLKMAAVRTLNMSQRAWLWGTKIQAAIKLSLSGVVSSLKSAAALHWETVTELRRGWVILQKLLPFPHCLKYARMLRALCKSLFFQASILGKMVNISKQDRGEVLRVDKIMQKCICCVLKLIL